MERVKNLLEAREKQLRQIKKDKEKALETAPDGSLRVCSHKNRTQYYHRTDPKDFNGVYIKEKDHSIAKGLAQKDYDKKVLCAAEKELKAIQKYFSSCPTTYPEEIYETLHKERQRLINPVLETDEQFIHKWESVEYQGKGFFEDSPEFYTTKKERVRSKSELIIADLLIKEEIPYRYEFPLLLKGYGRIYPDFTVLNIRERKEMYWEHLGMMDEPGYVEKALQKIELYERNEIFVGGNLILTFETRKRPISQKQITRMIQHYLK